MQGTTTFINITHQKRVWKNQIVIISYQNNTTSNGIDLIKSLKGTIKCVIIPRLNSARNRQLCQYFLTYQWKETKNFSFFPSN